MTAKRCPFCGKKAQLKNVFIPALGFKVWVAGCDDAKGPMCPGYLWKCSPVYLTEKQAAQMWNTRTKKR